MALIPPNPIPTLFSSPIYRASLNLNTKLIHESCSKLKKSVKGVIKSNQGGWQSPDISPTDLPILSIEIEKHANIFKDTFLFKNPLKICNMWVNINSYKDYNAEHSHAQCILSGVYYVKIPGPSGGIRFIHPGGDMMGCNWSDVEKSDSNHYNSEHWTFDPKENILFLFPSWLKHNVLPHLGKEERVSISFNLR